MHLTIDRQLTAPFAPIVNLGSPTHKRPITNQYQERYSKYEEYAGQHEALSRPPFLYEKRPSGRRRSNSGRRLVIKCNFGLWLCARACAQSIRPSTDQPG